MENAVKNCFDFRLIVKSIYYHKAGKIQNESAGFRLPKNAGFYLLFVSLYAKILSG